MSYEYSENILVQESSGKLLEQELGWEVAYGYNTEILGEAGTFGRKSYKDILLIRYLREALKKFNPWIMPMQIDEAQRKLEERLSSSSSMQINEEKYFLIKNGIPVTIQKSNGDTEIRVAKVIDFQHPQDNHFLAIKELKIHGDIYRRRTDIVGFVNGIPLLFIELKKQNVAVKNAYIDNYSDYLTTIPHLFYYNAFLMLSNGLEAKIGTIGSKYEFFHEWKRLKESDEGSVALETMLRGVCQKENFLDLLENFILYDHSGGSTAKILARNHQYLGVNEAVKAYENRKLKNGKLGVFWHTQGSGKSYSMMFLAQKIRRKFEGSPTFVVLTDRDELNKQISDLFENCGLLGKSKANNCVAPSSAGLIKMLKGNPSFIFTLIHKFNNPDVEPIYPDHDVVIMSDEAHRTQYGIFAENMMKMLPTASRIGFTATPLFAYDNITQRTFGEYVSIYDYKRAVEDGATVPLFYENRADKIKQLENPKITEEIIKVIETYELDSSQREKLDREIAKAIHILTSEPRLRAIAKDFAKNYSDLWTTGKAMFVCLDKVTCVRMYNFVQEYWQKEIDNLETAKSNASQQEVQELERKLRWMKETEMAVVVSQEQNEIQRFETWGLDILTHRQKMENRELDKEFKDSESKFRVVFVCAMWLTGFDVKSLSCLYLDKPLQAHTLMQTITRANRVSEGKTNGLIIDYIGIVKALREALAAYTANITAGNGADPTIDKEELLAKINEIIKAAESYLAEYNFSLKALVEATGFTKLGLLQNAANAMCETPEINKTFQTMASELKRLVKYATREDIDNNARSYKDAIIAIYDMLQEKRQHADNTELMVNINKIMNKYIVVTSSGEPPRFDISQINFERLRQEFARATRKNLIVKDLKDVIDMRLRMMLQENPGRIDYYERYQEIIDAYNAEQDRATIEKTFNELLNLAESLDSEQQRYIREGFSSEEELSLYDLLFKEDLSKQDIKKLKEVAVDLLVKVKEKIATLDHWTDKQETRATVYNLICAVLWEGLPKSYEGASMNESWEQVYEYVYSRYKEVA